MEKNKKSPLPSAVEGEEARGKDWEIVSGGLSRNETEPEGYRPIRFGDYSSIYLGDLPYWLVVGWLSVQKKTSRVI